MTADGSINCADQPAEQERLVAQLIYCETVAALMILSRGGSYVFKIFTALEHQMVCLMYLLSNVFGEVHMIKPGIVIIDFFVALSLNLLKRNV